MRGSHLQYNNEGAVLRRMCIFLRSDGQLVRDLKLNHMSSLLNSQMLSEQGIKLKWIGQRITRYGRLLYTHTVWSYLGTCILDRYAI